MAEENKIVVSLEVVDKMSAEISSIRASMESNLERQNDALKKSKTEVKSLGDELKGNFVNAIKGAVLAYAGLQGIQKITKLFFEARAEYQESVRLNLQLRNALGYTSAALEEQAIALGKKLIVDDDDIKIVQLRLANYVKEEAAILQLTPAVLDFAAATGMDAASAANILAKAVAGDVAELSRYGISFNNAVGVMERARSVTFEVNQRMKDQSLALAESKDWIDKLKVSWNAFIESTYSKTSVTTATQIKQMEKELADGGAETTEGFIELSLAQRLQYIEKIREYKNKEIEDQFRITQAAQKQEASKQKEADDKRLEEAKKVNDKLLEQRTESANDLISAIAQDVTNQQTDMDNQIFAYLDYTNKKSEADAKYYEDLDKLMQDKFKEEQKHIEYVKKAEQEKAENQQRNTYNAIALSGDLFSAIAGANERNAQEKKNIARVEALINTALAVTQVMGTPWMIPFVVTTGIAQQAAIANAKFATGTPYAPGGLSLIGENGPELMSVPRGAQIYNSTQTRNMVTNQGSMTINVMDNTGSLVDSMRRDIRSGAADQLVKDILSKANRSL